MSSVQSIRRAFDVLGTLGDGPLGVTEVADRAGLPKSTAARLLATLVGEGAVEQVPGDTSYRLGPRLVTLAGRVQPGALAGGHRPPDAHRPRRGVRRGGRPGVARRRPRPLHRPGRYRATGPGARLDRGARAAPCRVVGPGAAGVPDARRDRALPRAPAWSASRTDTLARCGRGARAPARGPPARVRLGDRGVRCRDLVGRGTDRGRRRAR